MQKIGVDMSQKILTMDQVENFEKINFSNKERISGVYGIVFSKKSRIKIYIGSSVHVRKRCMRHKLWMQENKHDNSHVQKLYNQKYNVNFILLERCAADHVLEKEREYQHKWKKQYLLNRYLAVNLLDIEPFLKKGLSSRSYTHAYRWSKKNFYNGTPCKEAIRSIVKDGYGYLRVRINKKDKNIKRHRLAYWEKTGEYTELVRHLCGNRSCYNPDHLAAGNHRDNNLDKSKEFAEQFELVWIKHKADAVAITKELNLKIYGNNFNKISSQVFVWEKNLGLDKKYPDIYIKTKRGKVGLSLRKDVQDFMQRCEAKYIGDYKKYDGVTGQKRNIKIMKIFNRVFKANMTVKQVGSLRNNIKHRLEGLGSKKRIGAAKNGMTKFVLENYMKYNDKELLILANTGNEMPRNNYQLCNITSARFRINLYRPKMLQGVVWNLRRRDSLTPWGIEAEKLVEYFGKEYSNEELAKICSKEFGEDVGFNEDVIQDIRHVVGSVGQT
jgi:hypothetical protein